MNTNIIYVIVLVVGMSVSSAVTYLAVGNTPPPPATCSDEEACAICSQSQGVIEPVREPVREERDLYEKKPRPTRDTSIGSDFFQRGD